jgi:hypothetical protein
VDTVAVNANGNFGIAGSQSFPVDAGVVLAELVGAQAGIVLAHIGRIGMAASAELRDLRTGDLAFEAGLLAHRDLGIVAGGITAVATGAGQAFLRVDILVKFFFRYAQVIGQHRVAIQACVFGLGVRHTGEQKRCSDGLKPSIDP